MSSNQLKQIRKDKGWSQERLAFELGITTSLVQKIEQGKRPITEQTRQRIKKIEN
ncbi:MAG: helix-turn-helix domain-containing protein [Spirochaetia bacterium]|nr:helix-turn-helix domain-containing protein [Spirochaetia bacterium]